MQTAPAPVMPRITRDTKARLRALASPVEIVAAALTNGRTLCASGFVAGSTLSSKTGKRVWLCVDPQGVPRLELEWVPMTVVSAFYRRMERAGIRVDMADQLVSVETFQRDVSAFGAARAFIKHVGVDAALAAVGA